jgi:hypothetical protein
MPRMVLRAAADADRYLFQMESIVFQQGWRHLFVGVTPGQPYFFG